MGIVSHGRGCAQADGPGIYTRLSYYYHWMEEILKRDGEHLEPDVLSYLSTTKHSSTSTSEIPSNSTYKYVFNVLIFGPFIFLLFLY